MARARQALQAEGFIIDWTPSDGYRATKGPYTALIMCDEGPEGRTLVNIVVAGNTGDPSTAEGNYTRLGELMHSAPTEPTGRGARGTVITWEDTPNKVGLGGKTGQRATFYCPPNGQVGRLYGTGVHDAESSICTAAVHGSFITLTGGGTVTIEMRGNAPSFIGSTQNGITSNSYSSYSDSFAVVRNSYANNEDADRSRRPGNIPAGVKLIAWDANPLALGLAGNIGQRFTVGCPAGQPGRLYGTGVHDAASSICTAAAHAGVITPESGGVVTIEIRGKQMSYMGSTRNGITSMSYESYTADSFVVIGK